MNKIFTLLFLLFLTGCNSTSEQATFDNYNEKIALTLKQFDGVILTPRDKVIQKSSLAIGDSLNFSLFSGGKLENVTYKLTKVKGENYYFDILNEGVLNPVTRYMFNNGQRFTSYQNSDYELDNIATISECSPFKTGDCEYEFLKSNRVLKTSFNNGVWTYKLVTNGMTRSVKKVIYEKNGLPLFYSFENLHRKSYYWRNKNLTSN
ncbi:hypothetical protein [Pseudoalteromonas phenolica]|uniref:hypothetical protein n=1 Tax=Pseudoalteromonas phenolica TaxID=161398 RepID=UPI00384B48C3